MSRILGVDPGLDGAVALFVTETKTLLAEDMPIVQFVKGALKRRELDEAQLAELIRAWEPEVAWVEQVHAMPRQGVASTFKFGWNYGAVRGVLAGLRVHFYAVPSHEWKRHFRLGPDKQQARRLAAQLFPDKANLFARVQDDGRAEACLLAKFGAEAPL